MKIGKFYVFDIVFVVVYLIILLWLINANYMYGFMIGGPTPFFDWHLIIWRRVVENLLYAIIVPVVYFGIRWCILKRKATL
jgi:hypothetical protein